MKTLCKRLLALTLSLIMIGTLVPAIDVAAASTKKVTLFKGEVLQVTDFSDVKSVSSSKKSVASVKKDSKQSYYANITAKKAGTATVKIKTKRSTITYKITVKNLSFSYSFKKMGNDYILLTMKNKTSTTFDSITVRYTLKDNSGNVVEVKDAFIDDFLGKKTAYKSIIVSDASSISLDSCSVKLISDSRSLSAKYKDESKNISYTDTFDPATGKLKLAIKNQSSNTCQGVVDILFYDSDNNLLGHSSRSYYLKSKNKDTLEITLYGGYQVTVDHYELKVRGYSKIY